MFKNIKRFKYSSSLIAHFENPKNIGSFDKNLTNVGTAIVGAPACGDVMKLQIKVNPTSLIIEDVCFKTFGCGSAIASSSVATEIIKYKHIKDAKNINNTFIAKYLNLPPVKLHCSMLAEDAITSAIENYLEKNDLNSKFNNT